MATDPRIAICPGSYDPITNGHLDVIARVSQLFDEVIVGIVNHPVRKGTTLFSTEERIAFIEEPIFSIYSIPGILWVHLALTTVPVMVILLGPSLRHRLQQPITRIVTQRIVDGLEVVQVEE